MKTYKDLYARVCAFENLYAAYLAARRGKRQRAAVAQFEFLLEPNLLQLQNELQTLTYRPGAYHHFYIYEPKQRLVSAAPFRDRVVHHALCNVIEPIWEARFIHTSYACRVGKGTHAALNRCHAWLKHYPYALQGDILQYFPSIDHQVLSDLLAKHLADAPLLWLIDQLLASAADLKAPNVPPPAVPDAIGLKIPRVIGLPIGNLTSQFWANVYLHELDVFVKQQLRCPAYLRYMDDFVLFAHDKPTLHAWKSAIADFLAQHLRLWLHPRKNLVFPTHTGMEFCGFRLYPTHRRLKRASIRRFVQRFRRQRLAYRAKRLSLEALTRSVQSWIAHAAHGDTWRLRNRLFRDYPLYSP